MEEIKVIIVSGLLVGPTYYAERFVDYMKSHDIRYHVLDVNVSETYNSEEFYSFARQPGVVMFTFNNIAIELTDHNGKNFWKANNIPVFDNIVDHPRNFAGTFSDPVCDLYVFAPDEEHVEFIERYYPKIKKAFFSPNGGWEEGDKIPYKDRKIQVLYMGDCQQDNGGFPLIDSFEDGGNDFYNKVISFLVNDPRLSTRTAIEMYCGCAVNNGSVSVTEELLYELNTKYAFFIETTVRRHFKLEGIKALDDLGVNVEIYGLNWRNEGYPFSDRIVIHDRVGRKELMRKIGDSKISLCFIPWFKRGCSEKNFDSMLGGAVCVTDRSSYLEQNYTDGENIIFFDLKNPAQMAADVKYLLNNPDKAERIATRGYETAKKYDTWFNRFDRIMNVLRDIKMRKAIR